VVFCSNRKHLLMTLLRLQCLVVSLFVTVYFYLCLFNYELYFFIYIYQNTISIKTLTTSIFDFSHHLQVSILFVIGNKMMIYVQVTELFFFFFFFGI
jgi:hypothetical protein